MEHLRCLLVCIVLTLVDSKMMDLTHRLSNNTPVWGGYMNFELTDDYRGPFGTVPWFLSNNMALSEHTGTHIDAPVHFSKGNLHVNEIPLERLVAPGVVIDFLEKPKNDPDAVLTVQDVEDFEKEHGQIPDYAVVFMYTRGGEDFWDINKYFGSDTPRNISSYHFPGFSGEAVNWLIDNRKINGIGIDRLSFDSGQAVIGKAHLTLLPRGRYGLENVANLWKIPKTGTTISVMPIPIEGGSGAPSRVVAFWDTDLGHLKSSAPSRHVLTGVWWLLAAALTVCL